MTRHRCAPSPLPLFAALVLGALAPAQQPGLSARIVVDFAVGVPSPAETIPLLLHEDALREAIQKGQGSAAPFRGIRTFPAHDQPGQCQVSFVAEFGGDQELAPEARDRVLEAVAAHLQQRLDEQIYREPAQRLQHRVQELLLDREHATRECAELQARADDLEAAAQRQRARADEVDRQRLAVQIELATEQRACEFLEKRRLDLQKQRAELRDQRNARNLERLDVENETRRLNQEILGKTARPGAADEASAELKDLRARLDRQNQRLTGLQPELARLDQDLADLQDQLTRTAEQLPPSALALQRARARAETLEAVGAELQKQQDVLRAQRADGARSAARLEQLHLDLDVGKQVLAELQQRLSRLEPVRVRVVR